jgi:hypothetical protein
MQGMEFYPEVQKRWLLSLICATLSLGVFFADRMRWPGEPNFSTVVALALSLMTAVIGSLSLLAKEKNRGLGVVGIVLSLVPWLTIALFP